MAKIEILCTEYEMNKIKDALVDRCPFEIGTIKECNEDSDCGDCQEKNIEFTVIESGGVRSGK